MLLSHLVNAVDAATREDRIAVVARHLGTDGVAVIQRLDPRRAWPDRDVAPGPQGVGLRSVDTSELPVVRAVTVYAHDGRE